MEIKRKISDAKLNYLTKHSKDILWFRSKKKTKHSKFILWFRSKKKKTKLKPKTEFFDALGLEIEKEEFIPKFSFL